MGIQVKICGVTAIGAVDAAIRAGADCLGLNFVPASPRYVAPQRARALAAHASGRVRLVALLADPDDAALAAAIAAAQPDFIQLHGRETPGRAAEIAGRYGIRLIKALAVAEAADFAAVPAFEAVADMLLFDAKPPKGAGRSGGHGAAFDWQLLQGRRFSRPWLLAGGLNVGNVAQAIATSGAPGVDVSSGVETAPGIKDPALIAEFAAAARGALLERHA